MIYDSLDSLDSSFESRETDPLPEIARIRVKQALDSGESGSFESAVDDLLCKNFDSHPARWRETTQQVMRGIIECLKDDEDAESKIRIASETTILAVARRWGNVVSAGKATVIASREAASKHGLNSVKAAQQAGLGAIEGVMRVGPVAYPVLRKELGPMVEDFEEFVKEQPNMRAMTPSQEGIAPQAGWLSPDPAPVVVEKPALVEPINIVEAPLPKREAPIAAPAPDKKVEKKGWVRKVTDFFKGMFSSRRAA